MSHYLFITQGLIGKTFNVNEKSFRVCPDHITGNTVLVSKRKITIEVLVLGADRSIKKDESKPGKNHYLHEKGETKLYSSYNDNQKAIFKHYSQFFE